MPSEAFLDKSLSPACTFSERVLVSSSPDDIAGAEIQSCQEP